MKIKKYILILLFAFVFVGCDKTLNPEIETPKNVQIDDGVVSWTKVLDADKYVVVVNTDRYDVSTNTYDLKTLNLPIGTYQISVIVVKGEKTSLPSEAVNYEVKAPQSNLATPSNVAINAGILVWNKVTNATGYIVYVGTKEYSVTDQIFNLNSLSLVAGTYSIKVKAVNNNEQSSASEVLSFVVSANQEAVVAEILLSINETYLPNMKEEDFLQDYEYREYYNTSQLVNAYAQIALVYLNDNNAVNFFKQFVEFVDSEEIDSFVSLKNAIDQISTYDLTAMQFSNIAVELSLAMLNLQVDDMNYQIQELENQIIEQNNVINDLKNAAEYLAVYNKLKGYVNQEDLPIFEEFMAGDAVLGYDNYSFVIQEFLNIANYIASDEETSLDPIYYYNDYELMFYDLVVNVKDANDTELLEQLQDSIYYEPLIQLGNEKILGRNYQELLDNVNNTLPYIQDVKTTISTNKQIFLTQIEDVVNYLAAIYTSVPITLLTKLDNYKETKIEPEEIMLLKDEIITILQETLPSEEAFANFYTTALYLSTIFHDLDINDYLLHAPVLGELDHLSLELLLLLMADIDLEMVNDIMAIVDVIIIPGEFKTDPDTGLEYYQSEQYDYEKVLDLILYIGKYLQDFKTANQQKFNQLEAISFDNASRDVLKIYLEIMKVQLKNQTDEENFALVSFIFEKLLIEYPNIVAGLEVFENIGSDVINIFLETEAVFFKNLIPIFEKIENGEFSIQELEELFSDFVAYNNALFQNLTKSDIEKILKMSKVPMMLVFAQALDITELTNFNSYETLFDELIDPVATVINNIVILEKELVLIVDRLEVTQLFNSWPLQNDEKELVLIIISLDELFIEANENLVLGTIDIIFENIFSNPNLMEIIQVTTEQINMYHDIFTDKFTQLFADVHLVAGFDFTNLQADQLQQVYEVIYNFIGEPTDQELAQ